MTWDEHLAELDAKDSAWWSGQSKMAMEHGDGEPLWEAALRVVSSNLAHTRKALVLRVLGGDLARSMPILQLSDADEAKAQQSLRSKQEAHPAIVIMANGGRFPGVTKFGRSSSQQVLNPDMAMSEPIASRSHFNIVYDQQSDSYHLVDVGSKWGTFTKVSGREPLSCGDWIRLGNAEFVVRYCGGGCQCRKRHAHYRLHALRVSKQHGRRPANLEQPWGAGTGCGDEERRRKDELLFFLSGMRQAWWTSRSANLFQDSPWLGENAPLQHGARALEAVLPQERAEHCLPQHSAKPCSLPLATQFPVPPLELDFISGARMGERLTVNGRMCTMGRGEGSSIQVTDPTVSNISRIHCIFEYAGGRWHLRDNNSTNGTWRRLSSVLEPSAPTPLFKGVSFLAGIHEFQVEEADTQRSWQPSVASEVLAELCRQEKHARRQRSEPRAHGKDGARGERSAR